MPPQEPDGQLLSKLQRNEIYRALENYGIPVSGFKLGVYTDFDPSLKRRHEPCIEISHPASASFYRMEEARTRKQQLRGYLIRERVGPAKAEDDTFLNFYRSEHPPIIRLPWRNVLADITRWALKVTVFVKEAEAYEAMPDLWKELDQDREFLGGQTREDLGNKPFTPDEQTAISAQLKNIKDYVTTAHELTSEQVSHLDARLEHAEEASRRMGRKDWITLFNGAVFSLILTDTITPDTAQHIILMALHGIGHLFGMGGSPPHLPAGG